MYFLLYFLDQRNLPSETQLVHRFESEEDMQ